MNSRYERKQSQRAIRCILVRLQADYWKAKRQYTRYGGLQHKALVDWYEAGFNFMKEIQAQ